ncbi:MAG: TonB-dependent receptor [Pseudomonadota bacterium]
MTIHDLLTHHVVKSLGRLCIATALFFCVITAHAEESSTARDVRYEEEIVVVGIFAEPDRMTGSAHRIGKEVLEVLRHDDVTRVLNMVPGVYSREEDGFGLRPNIGLRGGNSERSLKVALMEDGVLFAPAAYSAPAAYFFPLTQRMVGVEVFKGPSSIEFGPQTIGGAINLVSAPVPESSAFELGAALGSDAYRSTHFRGGRRLGEVGVLAEYVHVGTDGFKDIDVGGNTGFEKNEFMLKAVREIGEGALEVRLGYADELSEETYLGLTEADFRESPYRRYGASALARMEWDWHGGRVAWRQPLLGGELTTTTYYHVFERAWRKFNNFNGVSVRDVLANSTSPFNQLFVGILQGNDTDGLNGSVDDIRIGTNGREFLTVGSQVSIGWSFGDAIEHDLRAGVRYHHDSIDRLHDEFGFEQVDRALILTNQGRAIVADNTGETDNFALWVRDEISTGRWTIVPGLRVESISNSFDNRLSGGRGDNDYVVALPGIGVRADVGEGLSLLAGAHRGFSPASPSVTPNLEEEKSINYEFGGRLRGEYGRVELIGFVNDYSNLTAICTFSAGCTAADIDTQTNAGEVRTQGIEASFDHALDLGAGLTLPVALSYTYTDAEFQEAFSSTNPQFGDVEPGFELPYVPRHRANANIGIEGQSWGILVSVTHVDQMRDQAGIGPLDDALGADATTIIDIAARYVPNERWIISGRIDNAGDTVDVVSRRPFGARPSKPLSFRLEARYRFSE